MFELNNSNNNNNNNNNNKQQPELIYYTRIARSGAGVVLLTHVPHDDLHNGSKWHPDDMHTLAIAIRHGAGRALREIVSSDGTVYFCWYFEALA